MYYLKLNVLMLLLFCCLFINPLAYGHEQSVAKIELNLNSNKASIFWDVSIKDLVRSIPLDENLDGLIRWHEILNNREALQVLLSKKIQLFSDDKRCSAQLIEISRKIIASGTKIRFSADYNCQAFPTHLSYSFMQQIDSLHMAYLKLNAAQQHQQFLLKEGQRTIHFKKNTSASFVEFVIQGAKHILIGIDHLSFLIILFFSAKLNLNNKSFYHSILLYVTNFTIAHSITLLASSLNLISLPSWMVESVIAVSVVYGAGVVILSRTKIQPSTVFGFGLIHGLGFATVLNDLTGDISSSIDLLLAFNLGVEMGQIFFLTGLLLLLKLPLKYFGYNLVSKTVATPIMILGCIWIIERTIGI